jgi:hypothetical protein
MTVAAVVITIPDLAKPFARRAGRYQVNFSNPPPISCDELSPLCTEQIATCCDVAEIMVVHRHSLVPGVIGLCYAKTERSQPNSDPA